MGERPAYPTAHDVAVAREDQHDLRTHVAYPGRVQSYDPVLQVADVVPLIRHPVPRPDGGYNFEELPVLPHTWVCMPRSGSWEMSFPIAPGDTGLILCLTADIASWWAGNGDVTTPADLRRQHLAHAIFLPVSLAPRSRALQRTGDAGTGLVEGRTLPTGMVIGSDAAAPRVLLRAAGSVDVVTGTEETGNGVAARFDNDQMVHLGSSTGQFVALAPLVDAIVSSLKSAIAGWTPVPNDGGASLKAVIAAWSPGATAATKVKAT